MKIVWVYKLHLGMRICVCVLVVFVLFIFCVVSLFDVVFLLQLQNQKDLEHRLIGQEDELVELRTQVSKNAKYPFIVFLIVAVFTSQLAPPLSPLALSYNVIGSRAASHLHVIALSGSKSLKTAAD